MLLSAVSVVIIGESASSRTRLRQLLSHIGCRHIEEAAGGREALGKISARAQTIVFCDWEMEPMDGIALLHEVRPLRNAAAIRFLLLTTDVSWGRQTTARMAGADGVLGQPVRLESLRAKIDLMLARDPRHPYQRRA